LGLPLGEFRSPRFKLARPVGRETFMGHGVICKKIGN
jgi:hypothetical protein